MAAPDPRVQQLYMTPATRASYGEATFQNLPTQAGYPPQGVPTVFITRADIAKHYPGDLPANFSALDPIAKALITQAFKEAYRETGAPPSLMGKDPQKFIENSISRIGEGILYDSPLAAHASELGGEAAVISLPSKPQNFATTFSNVSGISPDKLPQLGTLGQLSDRFTQIIHEARHVVQDPNTSIIDRERDADNAANQAHPGFARLMQDARRFGAVHNGIRGSTTEHAGPLVDALGRQSFARSDLLHTQVSRVFSTVGEIALNEYALQRYESGRPSFPIEAESLSNLIEKRLETSPLSQEDRQALMAAQEQLQSGKSGAEVMESLKQTGPDGKVRYPADLRQDYQRVMLGEELAAQGPQAVAPLLHAAMSREPSPTATMPPQRAAMVREAAGQYLEAAGRNYPELNRFAALPAPNVAVEAKPGIVMPRMVMLEPAEPTEAPEAPAAKSTASFAPLSRRPAAGPGPN